MPEDDTTDDVIVNDQDQVTEPQLDNDQEGSSDAVSDQEQDSSSDPSQEQKVPLKLDDRPQYNIEQEVERKVTRKLEEIIPKLEEAVSKPKQQQYTLEQLEQFKASEDGQSPQSQAWANSEIRKLEKLDLLKTLDERQTKITQSQRDEALRQQAQQSVVSDPAYAEAFVKTQQGVTWNPNSQLAAMTAQIMQDPRVSNQPDGVAIAMELAYARLAKSGGLKQGQEVASLKRQTKKLQNKTLTEGAGVNKAPGKKSEYASAIDRLSRSGKEVDAVAAFNAYRKNNRG